MSDIIDDPKYVDLTVETIIARIKESPMVDSFLIFGSRADGKDLREESDLDCLILIGDPPVCLSVLHPVVEGGAVRCDLWVQSFGQLQKFKENYLDNKGSGDDAFLISAIASGRIIKDGCGLLSDLKRIIARRFANDRLQPMDQFSIASWRFQCTHAYETLKNRINDDPSFVQTMISMEVILAVEAYCATRGILNEGFRKSLQIIEERDTYYHSRIKAIVESRDAASRLSLLHELLDLAVRPIGGLIARRAFLCTGAPDAAEPNEQIDLQSHGLAFWHSLLG